MKNKKLVIGIGAAALVIVVAIVVVFNLTKVKYTKEFNYLPEYKNMKVEAHEEAKGEEFGNAVYTVKGEDFNQFLNKYEEKLKKDGWEVTKDKKPDSLEVKKGDHIVRINVINSKDELTVLVWTK